MKSKKFFKKGNKSGIKNTKKKRKASKDQEVVNKKAIFNRYKNAQKVEEVLEKKKMMDRKFQQMQVEYSESEEDEDAYGQLVSCFGGKSKQRPVLDSDDESKASIESDTDNVAMNNGTGNASVKDGVTDNEDSNGPKEHVCQ